MSIYKGRKGISRVIRLLAATLTGERKATLKQLNEKYEEMEQLDEDLSSTAYTDMFLDPKIFGIIPKDKFSRILSSDMYNIQTKVKELIELDEDFIKYLFEQDTWDMSLVKMNNTILKRMLQLIPANMKTLDGMKEYLS